MANCIVNNKVKYGISHYGVESHVWHVCGAGEGGVVTSHEGLEVTLSYNIIVFYLTELADCYDISLRGFEDI